MKRRVASEAGSFLFTAYVACVLLVIVPPIWVALLVQPRGRVPDRLVRRGARIALRLTGCRLRVRGLEHLSGGGSSVLVAYHRS